jgi:hypothetical protein
LLGQDGRQRAALGDAGGAGAGVLARAPCSGILRTIARSAL